MNGMNLLTVAAACGGNYVGSADLAVRQPNEIVIDSRVVKEGNLFAALPGEKVDGHAFVAKAFDAGAAACLVTHVPEGETRPCIVVEDVVAAMGDIAAAYRATLQIPVIGITGSVGKTTMKEMIASVLEQRFNILKTDKNYNNHMGVPMTLSVHFVVGYDFRFGQKGRGNVEKIGLYCRSHGLSYDVVPAVSVGGLRVSSTEIRGLLQTGRMDLANEMLGHPYELTDVVRHGYKLGTKMGTPTVNMRIDRDMLVPRHGVYATKVYLEDGRVFPGVTNIGVRPTVSGSDSVTVETFILDFSGDLYESNIRVEFFHFIRPERKFENVEALQQQILKDADTARDYFKKNS